MKWATHLVTSISFAFMVSGFFNLSAAGLVVAGVSSVVPDYIDIVSRSNHRGLVSHNLLIPLSLLILTYNSLFAGFVIGYGHHLMIDALTKQGVFLGKERIRGGLYSKKISHNVLVIVLHYVALILFLVY